MISIPRHAVRPPIQIDLHVASVWCVDSVVKSYLSEEDVRVCVSDLPDHIPVCSARHIRHALLLHDIQQL